MINEYIVNALVAEAQGGFEKHMANATIYLNNPVGIGEHGNVLAEMAAELDKAAGFRDRLHMLDELKQRELNGR
jgi:hypothetical protein